MDKTEERTLISRAKEGDMEAFETLIRKYEKNIYFLCHRMTNAHQAADDLAQETFIKAYFSLHSFKDGMNFFTWIRKIAVNSTLNYLKTWKREEPLGENDHRISDRDSSPNPESPHQELQRHQMEQEFKRALEALPSDQRIVFILRTYEHLSYEEIAQSLKVPRGTVMSRLNRARKKLKSHLSDYL
jgi:RNA polymerase sigma-70 factor (ECF subfamily)